MQRLEDPKPGDGCGYVVKVEESEKNLIQILERNGVKVLGVE